MGLIEDSVAARKAHMSYGTWKAEQGFKQYTAKPVSRCLNCKCKLWGKKSKFCNDLCKKEYFQFAGD